MSLATLSPMTKAICGRLLPKVENTLSKREEKEETATNSSPPFVCLSVSRYQVYDPDIFVLLSDPLDCIVATQVAEERCISILPATV